MSSRKNGRRRGAKVLGGLREFVSLAARAASRKGETAGSRWNAAGTENPPGQQAVLEGGNETLVVTVVATVTMTAPTLRPFQSETVKEPETREPKEGIR
jgi:hypothetical protein